MDSLDFSHFSRLSTDEISKLVRILSGAEAPSEKLYTLFKSILLFLIGFKK